MAKKAGQAFRLVPPPTYAFRIVKVNTGWDLRTVQWRIDVLREYVKNHYIRDGQAHVFINKNRNRSRWIVVWEGTPFLIMAPAGYKVDYEVSMKVASRFAVNDRVRDEILAEITPLE